MDEDNGWGYRHASEAQRKAIAQQVVEDVFASIKPQAIAVLEHFLAQRISATAMMAFELAMLRLVRELGRLLLQATIQMLERDSDVLPTNLWFECEGFRRRKDRTANRSIATRFGNITLWRTGYRSWQRDGQTIFPLELMLGLVENVSPAMLGWIGKTTAAAGMSQQATIDSIREHSGVRIGVKRLRSRFAIVLVSSKSPPRQRLAFTIVRASDWPPSIWLIHRSLGRQRWTQ